MNKKILVCDDDLDILEMLVLLLEIYGYEVISESESPKIFDLITKENPGLVIIDWWMPMLAGDEVIKRLRAIPTTKTLPIIMISAGMNGQQTANAAGATCFISKPFDIFNLLEKVEQHYAQAC